jgi:hypothetical protein
MILSPDHAWGGGMDLSSRLLGFYEQELHGVIEEAVAGKPDLVLNIGCAEGYYTIGLARRLLKSRVLAFDIDASARNICEVSGSINGVGANLQVLGEVKAEELEGYLAGSLNPFLFLDCEGAELDLLVPKITPSILRASLLVECHDFSNPRITATLMDRFSTSHNLLVINEGSRNPNSSPILSKLHSDFRWLAVNENRPRCMHWIYAVPLSSAP